MTLLAELLWWWAGIVVTAAGVAWSAWPLLRRHAVPQHDTCHGLDVLDTATPYVGRVPVAALRRHGVDVCPHVRPTIRAGR